MIETKRAFIKILKRQPILNKVDLMYFKRIRDYKREIELTTQENRPNKDEDIRIYRAEIGKCRAQLRRLRDQMFHVEVTLKPPFKFQGRYDNYYSHANHSTKEWHKFIMSFEQMAIQGARNLRKASPETVQKIGPILTTRLGNKTVGFTYAKEGSFLKAHVKKNIQNLYDGKTPSLPRKYIGIELEFCAPITEERFALQLFRHGIHKYAQLKHDGSLRPQNKEVGFELAILLEETNYKKGLKTITDLLKTIGAMAKDRRCGLHVHLDMRRRDKDLVFNNFVACQYALLSVVDPSRYNNEFCRVVKSRKFPTEFTGDRQERYKTINAAAYYKYKTLEIRMHEGSVDFKEITSWIDLLLKVANYSKKMKNNVTKLPALKDKLKLKDKLYNYILDRSCSWQIQGNELTRMMRDDAAEMLDRNELARTIRFNTRVAAAPTTATGVATGAFFEPQQQAVVTATTAATNIDNNIRFELNRITQDLLMNGPITPLIPPPDATALDNQGLFEDNEEDGL